MTMPDVIPPSPDEPVALPPFFDRQPERWDKEAGENVGGGLFFPDPVDPSEVSAS